MEWLQTKDRWTLNELEHHIASKFIKLWNLSPGFINYCETSPCATGLWLSIRMLCTQLYKILVTNTKF